MKPIPHEDLVRIFFSLSIILFFSKTFGELFQRRGKPSVIGEILAGILIGKTILGRLFPSIYDLFFPSHGISPQALEIIMVISIVFLMFVAGFEVDLSSILRQGRAVIATGLLSFIVPFTIGFFSSFLSHLWGFPSRISFSLFLGVSLSISAIPVIARVMMDMNILKSDVGCIILGGSVINNILGWFLFSFIFAYSPKILFHIIVFIIITFTVVRWLIDRVFPYMQARTAWPGSIISFGLFLALLGASVTEWIGIHGIFGSFMMGIAFGDTPHLKERTRDIFKQFVMNLFSPLFFGLVGVNVDFLGNFDLGIVFSLLLLAIGGMVLGGYLGGRISGMDKRASLAIGIGLNTRGAMEIILAITALEYGIINSRFFVGFVFMAVVTSLMCAPLLSIFLHRGRGWSLIGLLESGFPFVSLENGCDKKTAIGILAGELGRFIGGYREEIENAVLKREKLFPTGIGEGIAVPHARVAFVKRPYIAVGISHDGVDFDAPDGIPARVIFLLITPEEDDLTQLEIMGDMARMLRKKDLVLRLVNARSPNEFLVLLKTEGGN